MAGLCIGAGSMPSTFVYGTFSGFRGRHGVAGRCWIEKAVTKEHSLQVNRLLPFSLLLSLHFFLSFPLEQFLISYIREIETGVR